MKFKVNFYSPIPYALRAVWCVAYAFMHPQQLIYIFFSLIFRCFFTRFSCTRLNERSATVINHSVNISFGSLACVWSGHRRHSCGCFSFTFFLFLLAYSRCGNRSMEILIDSKCQRTIGSIFYRIYIIRNWIASYFIFIVYTRAYKYKFTISIFHLTCCWRICRLIFFARCVLCAVRAICFILSRNENILSNC